jgi:hypothetical protein
MPQRKILACGQRPPIPAQKCMIIEDAAMGEQESEQLQEKRARQEELGPVMGCQMDFRIGGAFPHDIVCARAPLMCRMQSGQSLWTPDAGMKILLESPKMVRLLSNRAPSQKGLLRNGVTRCVSERAKQWRYSPRWQTVDCEWSSPSTRRRHSVIVPRANRLSS